MVNGKAIPLRDTRRLDPKSSALSHAFSLESIPPMKRLFLAAALVCAPAIFSTTGSAQQWNYTSNTRGPYSSSHYDSGDGYSSDTNCIDYGRHLHCESKTRDTRKLFEPPPAPAELPTNEFIPFDAEQEQAKIDRRRAEGWKDPSGTASLCPAPHRMTRDGCQ
jgi:hypothetical protein